jgi:hypothetical protein
MAELSFDNYEFAEGTSNDYDLLPEGWYTASVNSAELRETKAGTGNYLNMRYDIIGPDHAGRVVFGMITIRNPNQTAERIGREQLSSLAAAIGMKEMPRDSDELIGNTVSIKVGVEKSAEYGDKNTVKGFKSAGKVSAPAAAPKEEPKADTPF